MTLRRVLFWCHLSVALVVGLVMAFLAVTGMTMAFQTELVQVAERGYRVQQVAGAACMEPSALLTAAEAARGAKASELTLFADRSRPAEVAFGHDATVLLNPCTGAVLSAKGSALRPFFWNVRELHRAITFQGATHEQLRAIKDAVNLGFLFLIVSGLVLWLPRKWTWQHTKPALLLKPKAKGRARDWNWHNVAGIWFALPLIVISASGAIMSYTWANALLYRAAGDTLPQQRAEREPKDNKPMEPKEYPSLNRSIVAAQQADASWQIMNLRIPAAVDKTLTVTIENGKGGRPQERVRLQVNRKKGTVTRSTGFMDETRGRRWRLIARFIHTGEMFGVVGKTVAVLSTLALLMLVWTGFALTWRRFVGWRKRSRVAKPQVRQASLA